MKIILTIAAGSLVSKVAFAQIGIIGGLTSSSTKVNVVAQELSSKSLSQYHVGVTSLMKMSGSTDRSWENVKNRFEYGCGVGAGVELFKRIQVSCRFFWNFNPIYGQSITEGSTVYKISDSKSKGITLSAVVFLK